MTKAYAGIGSRRCPSNICAIMEQLAYYLAQEGWMLRSGGADMADKAFQDGVEKFCAFNKSPSECQEIYLPWNGFNGLSHNVSRGTLVENNPDAERIASIYHPNWIKIQERQGVAKLIMRNGYQVLGKTLDDPVKFIMCWTPDGAIAETTYETGGTGHAIRIAHGYRIPVYNLQRPDHLTKIQQWIAQKS